MMDRLRWLVYSRLVHLDLVLKESSDRSLLFVDFAQDRLLRCGHSAEKMTFGGRDETSHIDYGSHIPALGG